ncbi:7486_t:CDS:1, partial [Dentiscutata erythropus]
LLENLPEKDDIQEYFQLINFNVSTEENLTEEQITNLIQSEENEESDSDEEEEILSVLVKDAVSRLETFIKYFEQQDNNSEFNVDDLLIFRKYLRMSKVKLLIGRAELNLIKLRPS